MDRVGTGCDRPVATIDLLENLNLLAIGGDENVFFETRDSAVVGEFFSSIETSRRGRQNFDNQAGIFNVLALGLAIAIVAGDGNIGIVESVASFDAGFHTFGEGATARTPEVSFEREE